MSLVLASGSQIRAQLLRQAGIAFTVEKPGVDEDAVKAELADATPFEIAGELAVRKALAVSERRPGWVIGADQTMELEGRLYDKAADLAEARARLLSLRGKTHNLNAGVALATGGRIVWRDTVVSRLTVRNFSEDWLDGYLARNPQVLASVACYELEGEGVQMFSAIEADFFAVLGLPMTGLLAALRDHGVIPS